MKSIFSFYPYFFIFVIFIDSKCMKFKESPLDPATPTGYFIDFILNQNSSSDQASGSPPGPKIIFVTATTTDGNMGGIATADTICNTDPNKPNSATFKAMLVDGTNRRACSSPYCSTNGSSEHIDWMFQPNTDYYKSDGITLAFTTDNNGLPPSSLTNGSIGSTAFIWTGLNPDWTSHTSDCNDWTSSASVNGKAGDVGSINSGWYSYGSSTDTSPCNNSYSLYCVQQ